MQGPLKFKLTQLYNHKKQRHEKTTKNLKGPVLILLNIVPGAQILIFELCE